MNFIDPNPIGEYPVVLLHGLGADASSWKLQFDDLAKAGFRPLAVDLPGFGETPHRGEWTISLAAQQVDQLLGDLKISSCDVVGISMGGVVAQEFAHQYPGKVHKLVLVNTFACLRPQKIGDWLYLLRRFVIANVRGAKYQAELVAKRLFPNADQEILRQEIISRILKSDRKVYRAAMTQLGIFDSRNWLKEIRCPTLVISADADTTVPLVAQAELARRIPGATQIVIPDARHAVIVDQPQRFNRAMLQFLQEKE